MRLIGREFCFYFIFLREGQQDWGNPIWIILECQGKFLQGEAYFLENLLKMFPLKQCNNQTNYKIPNNTN